MRVGRLADLRVDLGRDAQRRARRGEALHARAVWRDEEHAKVPANWTRFRIAIARGRLGAQEAVDRVR